MTNRVGSLGESLGSTYVKFHLLSGLTTILQYLSLMSSFENRMGPLLLGAVATA